MAVPKVCRWCAKVVPNVCHKRADNIQCCAKFVKEKLHAEGMPTVCQSYIDVCNGLARATGRSKVVAGVSNVCQKYADGESTHGVPPKCRKRN